MGKEDASNQKGKRKQDESSQVNKSEKKNRTESVPAPSMTNQSNDQSAEQSTLETKKNQQSFDNSSFVCSDNATKNEVQFSDYDIEEGEIVVDLANSQEILKKNKEMHEIFKDVKAGRKSLEKFIHYANGIMTPKNREKIFQRYPAEGNNKNIFHFMVYLKIKDKGDYEKFKKLFHSLVEYAGPARWNFLVEKNIGKSKVNISPLSMAVAWGKHYYVSLILDEIFKKIISKTSLDEYKKYIDLDLPNLANLHKEKNQSDIDFQIGYRANRRFANYLLINKILDIINDKNSSEIKQELAKFLLYTLKKPDQIALEIPEKKRLGLEDTSADLVIQINKKLLLNCLGTHVPVEIQTSILSDILVEANNFLRYALKNSNKESASLLFCNPASSNLPRSLSSSLQISSPAKNNSNSEMLTEMTQLISKYENKHNLEVTKLEVEKNLEIASLNEKINILNKEKEQILSALKIKSDEKEPIKNILEKIKEDEKTIAQLKSKLDILKKSESEAQALNTDIANREKALKDKSEEIEKTNSTIETLKENCKDLEEKNRRLNSINQNLNKDSEKWSRLSSMFNKVDSDNSNIAPQEPVLNPGEGSELKKKPFVFNIFIHPKDASERLNKIYYSRKDRNEDLQQQDLRDYPELSKFTVSAKYMMGFWGEETYYQFLMQKYIKRYSVNVDRPESEKPGYKFIGKKEGTEINISIEFANFGKYQLAIDENTVPVYKKGDFDLKVLKTINGENQKIKQKWGALQKITYIEVKATLNNTNKNNTVFFTKSETNLIYEFDKDKGSPSVRYHLIRIANAGQPCVNYRKLVAK